MRPSGSNTFAQIRMESGSWLGYYLQTFGWPLTCLRTRSCYGKSANVGVGSTPDWLGLFRVRLDVSSSFAS
jgi:hypothetical protein